MANVPISAGNTAPTVNITFPHNGGIVGWGDQVRFTVTVSDPEDGSVNCSRVTLQYFLGHDEHGHPIQSYTGCTGIVQIPASSGHGDEANVFSVFEATYTDNGGLVGRSTKQLQPKRKQAEHFAGTGRVPGGSGSGDPGVVRETTGDSAGGFQNIGWIEDGDYWLFNPVNLTNIDSIRVRAASPNAGGGRIEIRTGAADGPLLATATVSNTGGWQTYADFTAPLTAPNTTSGPLFFVVRGAGGGGILNVNWVDFIGRGMAEPQGGGTNLALGKSVTASSSLGGYPASNVNDDNPGSYWESTNNAFPQWIQVDLGAPTSIGSVTLKLPPGWGARTQTLSVLGGTDGSSWSALSASAGRVFDPATGNTVSIGFTAATVRYVWIHVTANTGWPAAQLSEFQIFAGTGTPIATLAATPASLDFGAVTVGSTSPARAVTIANTGTTAALITSISASAQFGQSNNCGSSLAAGASCTVNVTFSPTSAGAKTGTLTVTSNASNPSLTVSLSGIGTTAAPTNLALNKPATAGHVQVYVPANAVDDNVNSYWESPNNAFPQSFTVDLGATANLSSIVMKLPPGWGSRTQTLQILGSVNGSSFGSIVGSATYMFDPGSANTVTVTLPGGTTARYVRLTFTANTGWPAGQLSELQVMGTF